MKRRSRERFLPLPAIGLAVLVALCGCGGEVEGEAAPEADVAERSESRSAGRDASDAARSRGLPVESEAGDEAVEPEVLLGSMMYEWRVSPERGLYIQMEFVNPNITYERARGYVFAIASSSLDGSSGVYPWDAALKDGEPEDYRDGTHLLYRDDQEVSAFIPYRGGVGYYDRLKLLVFDEDGELLIGQTYELDVDGSPSGPRRSEPALVL